MPSVLAVFSGLILSASFPTWSFYCLSLIAPAPLLLAAGSASVPRAFALGWISGVTFYLAAWSWVLPTIAGFQQISTVAAAPLFLLFAAYHALQFALFAVSATEGVSGRVEVVRPLSIACWWVVIEWCFPRVIDWHLADAVAPSSLLRQVADIGGAYGLSLLIAVINSLLSSAADWKSVASSTRVNRFAWAVTIASLVVVYGAVRRDRYRTPSDAAPSEEPAVSVTVVQGNLQSGRRDLVQANEEAWRLYQRLTLSALEAGAFESDSLLQDSSALLIWPETTLRVYLRDSSDYLTRLRDLVRRTDTSILLGALDLSVDRQHELNTAYLLKPARDTRSSRTVGEMYHKRRLLAFGEYAPLNLPWRTTGTFVTPSITGPSTLTLTRASPGASATVFAPSICFEAIFAGAFNQAVKSGAQFLVNITDDGWFGDGPEPYQHLNATILRAVETRRWLVRASNSGVSAFIDPAGEIVASLNVDAEGVITNKIRLSRAITPYVHLGDWPVALSASVLGLTLPRWRRSRTH